MFQKSAATNLCFYRTAVRTLKILSTLCLLKLLMWPPASGLKLSYSASKMRLTNPARLSHLFARMAASLYCYWLQTYRLASELHRVIDQSKFPMRIQYTQAGFFSISVEKTWRLLYPNSDITIWFCLSVLQMSLCKVRRDTKNCIAACLTDNPDLTLRMAFSSLSAVIATGRSVFRLYDRTSSCK